MKLTELINNLNELFIIKNNEKVLDDDFTLYPKHLSLIKEQLQACDEFKDCELKILTLPNISNTFGSEQVSSESLALTPGIKFNGKIYIFSMWLTPEMYDPSVFLKKMKKDAGITQVIFNEETFEPYKYLIMKFSPEELQNVKASNVNSPDRLKSLLEKVLNNPTEYQIKGDRFVVIRGIFESIEFQSGKGRNIIIDDELLENYVTK